MHQSLVLVSLRLSSEVGLGLEGVWLVLGTTVLASLAPGDAQSLSLAVMQLRALDSILGFRAWRFVWPEGSSCYAARRSGHNI